VVEHPLQAFSDHYGHDARLSTYAAEWFQPAVAAPPFAAAVLLPTPGVQVEQAEEWTLDDLLSFVQSPARWFLRQRLGIRLRRQADAPADEEPFYLDGLGNYAVGQQLVMAHLAGDSANAAYARVRSEGALPSAAAGRRLFEQVWRDTAAFAARLVALLAEPRPDCVFGLDIAGAHLTGHLRGLGAQGLVDYRYAKQRARYLLATWVRHLAVNAVTGPTDSHYLTRDATLVFKPPADASALLADLLALARQGRSEALPLLPECALVYAKAGDHESGLKKARQAWEGDDFSQRAGEADDPDVEVAFRGREPLTEPVFVELAQRVFGPLLAAMQAPVGKAR
jgi:exodeoxyribonuclease V gamma subunit